MSSSEIAVVGDTLDGRYRLLALIGEGGMASVFRAEDTDLGRMVAVKVFRPGLTDSADAVRRESEKKLLASLNHPSLVTLFDAHLDPGGPSYLVMEYIDGGTLAQRFTRGPVDVSDASSLVADLGDALHVVHEANIVHRDVKPANILLRPPLTAHHTFRATLADFGIAHLIDSTRVTMPGTTIGTAAYISPEQVRGEAPTRASDIYSLGLVLIEALTGERAFGQQTPVEAVAARLTADPAIPAEFGYEWRSLLSSMTSRDPADRPSALEVAIRGRELDSRADRPATTEALAATAVLPASPGFTATAALVAGITAVLPAAETTSVLTHAAEPDPAIDELPFVAGDRARRKIRPLSILAVTVTLVVALIGAVFWVTAASVPGSPPALAEVGEPLGSHLQLLLEQVTP